MGLLKLLEWDTTFFGFPVARIVNPHASFEELRTALVEMQQRQIPLAYWMADKPSPETHLQAVALGAALVDEKTTFAAPLAKLPEQPLPSIPLVEPYRDGMSLADLKQLAVDSSVHSRFVVDTRFPRAKAQALYEEWIVRSLDKTVADEVLVIRLESHVVGMVTIGQSGDTGSIGLLAVAEHCRGRKFGEALVRAAQHWCRERALTEVSVVTQQANVGARRLYEKCGFELQKTEACYHLWSTVPV